MSEVFFPALFPGFEPPEELAQALERLAVVHAELDRDARTIRLDAQAEKYLAEKQLQTLCRAIEKAYGLKSLELSVRYPEDRRNRTLTVSSTRRQARRLCLLLTMVSSWGRLPVWSVST